MSIHKTSSASKPFPAGSGVAAPETQRAGANDAAREPERPARARMFDAAERLFAEHGIQQVSTREVLRDSGQSNQSALTYHFGSRLQLIAAMLDRRNAVINDLRHQRLDELIARQADHDLYALVEVLVTSVTDVIKRAAWGRDFVLTSVQVLFDPQLPAIEALMAPSRRSAYGRTVSLLRRALPTLPEPLFDARICMVGPGLGTNLAKWLRANGAATPSNAGQYDAMVRYNIDYMVGGLSAPVTDHKVRLGG